MIIGFYKKEPHAILKFINGDNVPIIYLLGVMLSGFFFTFLLLNKQETIYLRLALSPFLGVLLPSLIIYILNTLRIPIDKFSLLICWIPLLHIPIILYKSKILIETKRVISNIKSESKSFKFIMIILILGIVGYLYQGYVTEIWIGDGVIHWAPKAIEWKNLQTISYTNFIQDRVQQSLDYPLYHSIGMLINTIVFNIPPAYSTKLFDSIFGVGIFFTSLYFFKTVKYSNKTSIIAAFILTFSARPLISMNKAGYAEIELAYYLFLAFTQLINPPSNITIRKIITAGITLGVAAITKNEAIFRIIIILFFTQIILWKRPLSFKQYSALIIPFVTIILINKLNMPFGGKQFYYKNFNLTLEELPQRILFQCRVLAYHFELSGILKSSWPLLLVGSLFATISNIYSQSRHKQLIITMFSIFSLNFIFSFIPNLINTNFNNPGFVAHEIVMRINLQIILFLSAICTLWIVDNFKHIQIKKI